MDQEKQRIGTIIRKYRKRNHLTQEQLSEQCDITPGFLGQVERGETSPSIHTISKLIQALNLDANILFYPKKADGDIDETKLEEIGIRFSRLTKEHQKVVLELMHQLAKIQQGKNTP